MTTQPWDAIVVGGGHNGLVAAAYLGRGGMRTLLLEGRDTLGGAIGTSEIAPSAHVPTLAHTVGRLAPAIARELALTKHGLRLVQPAALATSVGGGGSPITLWNDPARTAADLAAVSTVDAAAWVAFDAEVRALASTLWRLLLMTPPDTKSASPDVLASGLKFGWRYRRLEARHAREFTRMLPTAIADYLEDNLESDALRALLATRGLRYTAMGPHHGGTSAVMLTDSAGNTGGAAGETVYARGGPGALAAALADAARSAGVEIRTGARVVAFRDDHERIGGVALADGTELDAPVVVSGLDPRTTLQVLTDPETLGPELGWEVDNFRDKGVTAKVNLALADLPTFDGLEGDDGASRLRGRLVVAPTMRYLDQASDAPKYGRVSEAPWLEATIPSLVDPLLVDGAAAGGVKHVMSVLVQSAPYALREGSWDDQREALGDRVIETLESAAPGIRALVVERQVLTPADIAAELGTSGGHPLHLEPGLDQWFAWRPLLGYARHRMPVKGLYLAGAGAHPGGGVSGLPGRNAAAAVLADRKNQR
ncbi:MAG: NAD(P)/FAD-dependent oxidoreductase [Candidatus Limnocylindrales bacterium]